VALLCRAALLCDDDVRLQTAAPHLLALVTQSEAKRVKGAGGGAEKLPASVRALALRCLVRLVASVQVIPPSDAKVGRAGGCAAQARLCFSASVAAPCSCSSHSQADEPARAVR
jgi:hypothetical protein